MLKVTQRLSSFIFVVNGLVMDWEAVPSPSKLLNNLMLEFLSLNIGSTENHNLWDQTLGNPRDWNTSVSIKLWMIWPILYRKQREMRFTELQLISHGMWNCNYHLGLLLVVHTLEHSQLGLDSSTPILL